jgi:hypothetical protein
MRLLAEGPNVSDSSDRWVRFARTVVAPLLLEVSKVLELTGTSSPDACLAIFAETSSDIDSDRERLGEKPSSGLSADAISSIDRLRKTVLGLAGVALRDRLGFGLGALALRIGVDLDIDDSRSMVEIGSTRKFGLMGKHSSSDVGSSSEDS